MNQQQGAENDEKCKCLKFAHRHREQREQPIGGQTCDDPEEDGKGKDQGDNHLGLFQQGHPSFPGSPFGRDEPGDDENAQQQEEINLITQKIQTAITVEEAIQIAVREIGRALGNKSTVIAIDPIGMEPEIKNQ